jgi:hypothetical protein
VPQPTLQKFQTLRRTVVFWSCMPFQPFWQTSIHASKPNRPQVTDHKLPLGSLPLPICTLTTLCIPSPLGTQSYFTIVYSRLSLSLSLSLSLCVCVGTVFGRSLQSQLPAHDPRPCRGAAKACSILPTHTPFFVLAQSIIYTGFSGTPPPPCIIFMFVFEIGSHYVAQASLKLTILLL